MDPIGWFIATLHQLIGHDQAAAALEVPPGDRQCCLICRFEQDPTDENRQVVRDAIGTR